MSSNVVISNSISIRYGSFRFDHRADALTGEELEEERVRDTAVEDVGAPHAVVRRASTHDRIFGIIPSDSLPSASSALEPGNVDPRDQRGLVGIVGVEPGDVGEVDELLRVERLGDRAGDGVGVDVVGLARLVDADRRDHRDQVLVEQPHHDRRVDARHVADEAEALVAHRHRDQARVLAREARPRTSRGG